MAFGAKANDTSKYELDGVTFEVNRIDTAFLKEFSKVQNSQAPMHKKQENKYKLIVDKLINSWSGATFGWVQDYFVSNETHFAAKSYDVDGDNVDICRASFEQLLDYSKSLGEFDYTKRAKIAVDELLETKDAKIVHGGKVKKMNASIREEIKSSDSWNASVVSPIWDMAVSFDQFKKGDDLIDREAEFKVTDTNKDLLKLSHPCWGTKTDVLQSIYDHAMDQSNFIEKQIQEDEEYGKN